MENILKNIKSNIYRIYQFFIFSVLFGIISNWFFKYSDETNYVIETAMFCLIGIAYLTFAWAYEKRTLKLILFFCGAFLILMNFIIDFEFKSIIGLVCIIVPMIIGRFFTEEEEEEEPEHVE